MTDLTREGLVELAERVEQASGPDRELDITITLALGMVPEPYERATSHGRPQPYFWDKTDSHAPYVTPEDFTGSVDAASSLVPKGWGWMVSQPNEKAIASGLLKEKTPVLGEVQYGCDERYAVAAATPALALCAASLKARARAMEAGRG